MIEAIRLKHLYATLDQRVVDLYDHFDITLILPVPGFEKMYNYTVHGLANTLDREVYIAKDVHRQYPNLINVAVHELAHVLLEHYKLPHNSDDCQNYLKTEFEAEWVSFFVLQKLSAKTFRPVLQRNAEIMADYQATYMEKYKRVVPARYKKLDKLIDTIFSKAKELGI